MIIMPIGERGPNVVGHFK